MTLKNTTDSYGWLAKSFHWLIALLIITLLIVGNIMTGIPKEDPLKFQVYGLHKSIGLCVLALAIARLSWRMLNIDPAHPGLPRWQVVAANSVHYLLYIFMFAMPLSGWAMSSAGGHTVSFFGLFDMPNIVPRDEAMGHLYKEAHELISWTIVALLCAHIGAALLHHFYYKDNILKRMLP